MREADSGLIMDGPARSRPNDYSAWPDAQRRFGGRYEALEAFHLCSKLEGIIPALEPAHALARVGEIARDLGPGKNVVMNLCGRDDKDIFIVAKSLGRTL